MIFILLTGMFSGCTTPNVPEVTEPSTEPTKPYIPGVVGITISEVMPQNKHVVMGHEFDWIELYNKEDVAVDLTHYYLTDDLDNPYAYSLEGKTIPADGYLVVALDESAPFRLSALGETVYLIYVEDIVAELTYGASEYGESYDLYGTCQYPTPGYANNKEGYLAYLQNLTLPELIITEVMTSNSEHMPVNGGCYDMVELRNNSDTAINLGEYTLSDKRTEPQRFTFPSVTLQPGEYYVVYCSGDTSLGENHTSFKLSSEGETVYLGKNGAYIDAMVVPADLEQNRSYGRVGNVCMYLSELTFGSTNSGGYEAIVSVPAADVASGVYQDSFMLNLSAEGDIYYTLDGTRPTKNSKKYTGPIKIDGVTTVRTFCVSGDRVSEDVAYTYVVGVSHTLPVLNIAISQDALTGDAGILNHIDKNYEYEAMLTLIENGEEKFSIPFGFRLHGNDSRTHIKQNFQLRFRSEYGAGKLKYKVFDDLEFTEYHSLLLKGGSETWMTSMLTEELATGLAFGTTNVYSQASKPVVLYLGGEFWGVYFIRERYSDDYVASHLGVNKESVDLLYSTAGSIQTGSNKDFKALKDYVQKHDMSKDEHYAYLVERIDVMSLIDWYVCRSYMGDRDPANIRRFRSSEHDGKWRWMYFDLDWSFYPRTDEKPLTWLLNTVNGEPILINALLKHPEGRDLFLKRYAQLMDTILNEEYILAKIDSLVEAIQPEMEMDRQRWGTTYSRWEKEVEKLRNYVRNGVRQKTVLADIQGYFKLTDAQMKAYFG